MDELVDTIVRRTEIEAEQARLIVKMVESYEREHSPAMPNSRFEKQQAQTLDQDELDCLSGRGFLG